MLNVCPICQGNNRCGNNGEGAGSCWCTNKIFSEEVFRQIPNEQLHKQCVCEACLNRITEIKQANKRSFDR